MERSVLVLGVLALLALLGLGDANKQAPKVEVYARSRAAEGKANTFHCFITDFHPPQITVELLKNGEPMNDVKYGDLSFDDKWQFQRLVYAPFTPRRGETYACRVTHSSMEGPQTFQW
ncbi:B2MG protein, partial [Pitta sordida]|nr:B2MG protein [Pitta sordida]